MLSHYQQQAIGKKKRHRLPVHVWNEQIHRLFDPFPWERMEQAQTYAQFIEMVGREPNEDGTGRYAFKSIDCIEYFFVLKSGGRAKQEERKLKLLLKSYLRLPLRLRSLKWSICRQGVIDLQSQLIYQLPSKNKAQNVHDWLNLLMEFHRPRTILLAIVDSHLHQEGESLFGRACGDGVAVVSCDATLSEQCVQETIVHETLHTLGFDHCAAWRCLMNANMTNQFWLCPACLRKLYSERELKSPTQAAKWVIQLSRTMHLLGFEESAKKGRLIAKAIL